MPQKFVVSIIEKDNYPVKYIMTIPSATEPDFYRQGVSLNCFFYGLKGRNKNGDTLYTCEDWESFLIRKEPHPDTTFNSLWKFYTFIGYNYKKQRFEHGTKS